MLRHVRLLSFEQEPNYNELRGMFRADFEKLANKKWAPYRDCDFCWMEHLKQIDESMEQSAESMAVSTVRSSRVAQSSGQEFSDDALNNEI